MEIPLRSSFSLVTHMVQQAKRNWSEILSVVSAFISAISVISIVFFGGRWMGHVDEHISNSDVHMPLKETSQVFVPRQEIEVQINAIKETVDDVQQDVTRVDTKLDILIAASQNR